MANSNNTLPLYEKVAIKRTLHKALDITILSLLILLLSYRLFFIHTYGFSWPQAIAFFCEFWFTFTWVLVLTTRWNFFDYKTYPDRLLKRAEDLPPVDIFVTTADAELEPPIITINTVLSLLAVDYPADKLACYVSDDGGSPLTFYSLSQALNFAKIWVPFCNKYKVQVRAPFRYFYNNNNNNDDHDYLVSGTSPEFLHEWTKMKEEYEKLSQRIDKAARRDLTEELPHFSNIKPNNHTPIIEVLWENKEAICDGLPHLIYVCREKRPKHQHHYKAGAMNVLTRISGLMTNAPYILNVDCDMFVNNPNILLHAMCLLQDPIMDKEYAFVQFPQSFYDGLKDDPYGNQFHVMFEFVIGGSTALQGPVYMGTGCIHRRKILYGQCPYGESNLDDELYKTFSFEKSENLKKSIIHALEGINYYSARPLDSLSIGALKEVASCDYEHHSNWGKKVGWLYGSATEDLLTGMGIHKKGWKSVLVSPNPKAFLGCAPSGGPTSLKQQKRWVTGQLEVLFSTKSPIFDFVFDKLQLRQCMFYLWILLWGIRSIPELLYALLPPYSLIAKSHFFPNVQEPAACIPLLLFVTYNLQQLLQYLEVGQSIKAWWNNQKMGRVNTMCAYFFGVTGILLKQLGLSETMFEVTKKGSSSSNDEGEMEEDLGRFTFDDTSIFVPATTVLMIQLAALSIVSWRLVVGNHVIQEVGLVEMICCVWLILCFWPFFKGMFAKGRLGIPWPTLCKSIVLTLLFVLFVLKN